MPKLIDYPRTSYTGAWELAEVTDDTGGKCAIETAARKLNRKVSGSFKAIIGSAVKFGLITSKRELLTTTTLFKRIKHAYDKQEELLFHREAFLTPPLFTQICRKFRSRELPVQMLDVMLIREFGVEEINAQGVAKAFVEGCHMVGLLDEHNIMADIDATGARQLPRRELANTPGPVNSFRPDQKAILDISSESSNSPLNSTNNEREAFTERTELEQPSQAQAIKERLNNIPTVASKSTSDAIATLFGLEAPSATTEDEHLPATNPQKDYIPETSNASSVTPTQTDSPLPPSVPTATPYTHAATGYQIQVSGPGVNTALSITEEEDIALAMALLEKIRRQLKQ